MNRVELFLTAALVLELSGCVVGSKPAEKTAAAAPAAPRPTPPPAPAPPPQPLSIPQTQAHLPAPQPINPDALATIQRPPQPPEAPPETRPVRRPTGPVAGPPKPGEQPTPQPPAVAATPVPAEPERPTVQEIVPAGEAKRLQDTAIARKQEVRKMLEQIQARTLTTEQRNQVSRIQSFLQLSDDAEKAKNMRQADDLAERAQVLARELQSGLK